MKLKITLVAVFLAVCLLGNPFFFLQTFKALPSQKILFFFEEKEIRCWLQEGAKVPLFGFIISLGMGEELLRKDVAVKIKGFPTIF